MVKARRELVLLSCFLSGTGTVLTFLSLFTSSWIVSQGEFTVGEPVGGQPFSEINYGLFYGNLNQKYGSTTNFPLTVTCLISNNVCAYLCKTTKEQRSSELTELYNGHQVSFDPTCAIPVRNQVVMTVVDRRKYGFKSKSERRFINAGLYYSTVVFVCLSGLFGLISTAISAWNVVDNPIEVIFSFIGLYVYNSVAGVASLSALVLWAVQYLAMLQENVGILYTIMGQMNTDGLAGLGYSYWLNLPACLLYASSIFVLYVRQYLVNQDPESKIHLPLTASGGNDVADIVY